jgi:hypothetical protein
MRAGPLSQTEVIDILNRAFVPVYASNEDYVEGGAADDDERRLYQRIYREALDEGRHAGSVCVYLVAPDGDGFDSLIVSDAAEPGRLLTMLEAAVDRFGTVRGEPLAEPHPQSFPPEAAPRSMLLHIVSRIDHRFSWGEFPSENWVICDETQVGDWLPPAAAAVGESWTIDPAAAGRLLTHFYPQTETCDFARDALEDGPHRHRIQSLSLAARKLADHAGQALIRLDGAVRIKHTFYPDRDDDNVAIAEVVGYLRCDEATRRVSTLRLVTRSGTYGNYGYSVAASSIAPPRAE